MNTAQKIIRIFFFINIILFCSTIIAPLLRKRLVLFFPAKTYLFANEMRNRYIQQRYIFTYLKLKIIKFTNIKSIDNIFFLEGIALFDNATKYNSLAPIIQYKIVYTHPQSKEMFLLDQGYYKMNSIIPANAYNHKIFIQITKKINSKLWKKISKKTDNIIIFYKLLERYD